MDRNFEQNYIKEGEFITTYKASSWQYRDLDFSTFSGLFSCDKPPHSLDSLLWRKAPLSDDVSQRVAFSTEKRRDSTICCYDDFKYKLKPEHHFQSRSWGRYRSFLIVYYTLYSAVVWGIHPISRQINPTTTIFSLESSLKYKSFAKEVFAKNLFGPISFFITVDHLFSLTFTMLHVNVL